MDMLRSARSSALVAALVSIVTVQAGEMDMPGIGYLNRAPARAPAPWKRASSQQTFGLLQNYQGQLPLLWTLSDPG